MTSNHVVLVLTVLALGLVAAYPAAACGSCAATSACAMATPIADRLALSPPPALPRVKAPALISVPEETLLPETCQLITPLGIARGVDRSWGAIPEGLSRVAPREDGAYLGFRWGVGSLVPYVGTTGYRCCGSDGCRICDATSCRAEQGSGREQVPVTRRLSEAQPAADDVQSANDDDQPDVGAPSAGDDEDQPDVDAPSAGDDDDQPDVDAQSADGGDQPQVLPPPGDDGGQPAADPDPGPDDQPAGSDPGSAPDVGQTAAADRGQSSSS